jgi:formate hydrogenlyase subunit 4
VSTITVAQGAAAAGVLVLAAPLTVWAERRVKAWNQMRRGPGPLQPYRDLRKAWAKRPLVPDTASPGYRWAAVVAAAVPCAALLLLPVAGPDSALGGAGALLVLVGLLAVHRFVLAAQGYATATPFGGLGASRELFIGGLGEPVLLLVVAALFLKTGTAAVPVAGLAAAEPSTWLLLGALGLLWVAESARIPFDNPATHLELTMVHEAMVLESTGWMLALHEVSAAVKQTVLAALLVVLAVPLPEQGWMRVAAVAAGVVAFSAALAGIESGIAKVRLFRASHILITAALTAFLAGVVTFLEARA